MVLLLTTTTYALHGHYIFFGNLQTYLLLVVYQVSPVAHVRFNLSTNLILASKKFI